MFPNQTMYPYNPYLDADLSIDINPASDTLKKYLTFSILFFTVYRLTHQRFSCLTMRRVHRYPKMTQHSRTGNHPYIDEWCSFKYCGPSTKAKVDGWSTAVTANT